LSLSFILLSSIPCRSTIYHGFNTQSVRDGYRYQRSSCSLQFARRGMQTETSMNEARYDVESRTRCVHVAIVSLEPDVGPPTGKAGRICVRSETPVNSRQVAVLSSSRDYC